MARDRNASSVEAGWATGHYHNLIVLFFAFGMGMFGNATMSLAIFGLSKDSTLKLSTSLLSVGSAGYSFGKLFGGSLSDVLGGKGTLSCTLGVMGCCQWVISRTSSFAVMRACWVAHRFAHAMTWMGVMLVARPWFVNNRQAFAVTVLTSSCRSGFFLGSFLGGSWLARGWRGTARSTSLLTFLVAALQLTLRPRPPKAHASTAQQRQELGHAPPHNDDAAGCGGCAAAALAADDKPSAAAAAAPTAASPGRQRPLPILQVLATVLFRSPKLWLVYLCSSFLTPVYDLASLLPMWLDSLGAMSETTIGRLGSVSPLTAVPAIVLAGSLHNQLSPQQRQWLYAPLLCVTAAGCFALSTLGPAPRPGITRVVPGTVGGSTLASPAVIGAALMAIMAGLSPAFYIPNYDFILRFAGPYTGTLTGLCDCFGNFFCTFIYAIYPRMLQRGGWPLVFRFYALLSCGAAGAILAFTRMESKQPLRVSPLE